MVILAVMCILSRLDRDFSHTFDNWKIRWAHYVVKGENILKGITFMKAYDIH
jgi:hypothetical protein